MSAGHARILVVEDNDTLRRGIALALRESWSDVDDLASGDAAVAQIRDRKADPYDVVITDLRLPGSDGLAVLAAARERTFERGGLCCGFAHLRVGFVWAP